MFRINEIRKEEFDKFLVYNVFFIMVFIGLAMVVATARAYDVTPLMKWMIISMSGVALYIGITAFFLHDHKSFKAIEDGIRAAAKEMFDRELIRAYKPISLRLGKVSVDAKYYKILLGVCIDALNRGVYETRVDKLIKLIDSQWSVEKCSKNGKYWYNLSSNDEFNPRVLATIHISE